MTFATCSVAPASTDPDVQKAASTSADALDVYFQRWNRRDYLLVTAGVSFLCVSFFVGLIRSLVSGFG